MARKITPKQKKFADKYLETGNATISVLEAYNTESKDVAKSMGSENLARPNVREYIESHAERAVSVVLSLMEGSSNDTVRLNSAKDVLDRAGYNAIDKSVSMTANVSTEELRKTILEDLARFRGSTKPL